METVRIEPLPGLSLIGGEARTRRANGKQPVTGEQGNRFFEAGRIGWAEELPGLPTIAGDSAILAGLLFLLVISPDDHTNFFGEKVHAEQTSGFTGG